MGLFENRADVLSDEELSPFGVNCEEEHYKDAA